MNINIDKALPASANPPEKVTIVEVAELAGVSISAVSRAFNPQASCSGSMREKVFQAAEMLGYKPNRLARGIRSKSHLIGLLVADFENPFYLPVISAFTQALQHNGYHCLLINVVADMDISDAIELVMEYQVDGLIVTSSSIPQQLAQMCAEKGIPLMVFARHSRYPQITSVCCDNREGGRMAADVLLAGGYTRFAYIGGVSGSTTTLDRQRGFVARLVEMQQQNWQVIEGGEHSYAAGYEATLRLFNQTEAPDALFYADDIMAIGGLDALRHELGIKVPEEVGVVGMDDIPLAASRAYDLTTIRQPYECMVQETVKLMLSQLQNPQNEPPSCILPCALVERRTCR